MSGSRNNAQNAASSENVEETLKRASMSLGRSVLRIVELLLLQENRLDSLEKWRRSQESRRLKDSLIRNLENLAVDIEAVNDHRRRELAREDYHRLCQDLGVEEAESGGSTS